MHHLKDWCLFNQGFCRFYEDQCKTFLRSSKVNLRTKLMETQSADMFSDSIKWAILVSLLKEIRWASRWIFCIKINASSSFVQKKVQKRFAPNGPHHRFCVIFLQYLSIFLPNQVQKHMQHLKKIKLWPCHEQRNWWRSKSNPKTCICNI